MKTLTDEYVETFNKPEDFSGIWARMLLSCGPPEGVDFQDKRLLKIVAECEKACRSE